MLLASDSKADADPGLQGNLMLDRMLGAKLHIVAASVYFKHGCALLPRLLSPLHESQRPSPPLAPPLPHASLPASHPGGI